MGDETNTPSYVGVMHRSWGQEELDICYAVYAFLRPLPEPRYRCSLAIQVVPLDINRPTYRHP